LGLYDRRFCSRVAISDVVSCAFDMPPAETEVPLLGGFGFNEMDTVQYWPMYTLR